LSSNPGFCIKFADAKVALPNSKRKAVKKHKYLFNWLSSFPVYSVEKIKFTIRKEKIIVPPPISALFPIGLLFPIG
jgi:hypothetical protein